MIDLLFICRHINTDLDDIRLGELAEAAESAVRAYTHNRFPHGLPPDVQMGIVNMIQYRLNVKKRIEQGKENIASETLSRHSVTYVSPDDGSSDSVMGYPVSIMGFCKPYRRPRT